MVFSTCILGQGGKQAGVRSQSPSGFVGLFDTIGAQMLPGNMLLSQSPSGFVGLFDSRVGKRRCHADFRARFAGRPSFLTLHRRFYTPNSLRIQYRSCATSSACCFEAKICSHQGFFITSTHHPPPAARPVAGEGRPSKPVSAPARCANSGAEK